MCGTAKPFHHTRFMFLDSTLYCCFEYVNEKKEKKKRFDMMNISDKKFPSHRMCSFSSFACTFHDSTMFIIEMKIQRISISTHRVNEIDVQSYRYEAIMLFFLPLIELFDILFTLIFQSFHSMRGLSAFYCLTTAKIICRSFFFHSQHSLCSLLLTHSF